LTSLVLLQSIVNVLLFTFMGFLWKRLKLLTGDEGRLKQGLQILQTKLAILEDLSAHIETQMQQANQIFETKEKSLENLLEESKKMMSILDEKSFLITASSETLRERENAIKFTQAALLAHKGLIPSLIAEKIGLGLQESELIYSLNRETLQFKVEELPHWMIPHIESDFL
jgi:hypothetical protein